MSEFINLGHIAEVKNGYAFKSKDFVEEGIPVIKIKNITPPIVSIEGVQYVSERTYIEHKKYEIIYNDILISMTGSGINQMSSAVGKVGRVKYKEKSLQNQRVGKIVIKDDLKYNSDFLYYYLSMHKILEYLVMNSTGSANQANISKRTIENIKVPNISLPIQTKIANILSLFDDKIENNNAIIANLEEQAQTIFKSWFVDFVPFQDGEFVESEQGRIPKKWQISSLDKMANYKNGLAMQKYRPEAEEESLPVLKIKELRANRTNSDSDRCTKDIPTDVLVENGDIIFSWSGSLLVEIWTGGIAGLNQHLFKVTSDKYHKWFYYYWTKFFLNQFSAIARDRATTMGHIKRSHLKEAKILIPDGENLEKMNKVMDPIVSKLINLGIQNKKLEKARDTLLPKLMSGEIRVEEAIEVKQTL